MLLALLLGAVAFVIGYVIVRKREQRTEPSPPPKFVGPLREPAPFVDLKPIDGKTLNLSSGQPVVSDTPEDRAAIAAAMADIEAATRAVTFEAEKKKAESETPPKK